MSVLLSQTNDGSFFIVFATLFLSLTISGRDVFIALSLEFEAEPVWSLSTPLELT
jgi:hypothetical protein